MVCSTDCVMKLESWDNSQLLTHHREEEQDNYGNGKSFVESMKIPGRFWAEAVRCLVYLLNRLPTKAMGDRTPYEAWNGRKPHLGHLRICQIRSVTFEKLDDRSVLMVYFGIEDSSKAHMMYNPQNNKIVVSRDVVFEEVVMWSWDAVETEDFSVELENGQFFPQII